MTKDRSFRLVEPFKVGYRSGSLPMLIAENSLGFTAQIEIQECDLDVEQARALRDWLNSVLPDEPREEREGMKFGCNGCGTVVTLAFTDASKQYVDIRSIDGWMAGAGGTWCPKCTSALNRNGD